MRKWVTQHARVMGWLTLQTNLKPPTKYEGGQHPIEVRIGYPAKIGIVQLLVPWVFTILPGIVMMFYGIYAGIMWLIGDFKVIFGGKMSESTHNLMRKYLQQMLRVTCFMMFLTDQKPPIVPQD
jgi:hypothetical protein